MASGGVSLAVVRVSGPRQRAARRSVVCRDHARRMVDGYAGERFGRRRGPPCAQVAVVGDQDLVRWAQGDVDAERL